MGIFSRVFGRSAALPEWAALLGAEQYAVFEVLLGEALGARSLPNGARDLRAGTIEVTIGKERATLNFNPIARKCLGIAQDKWAGLIAEHLDRALESNEALVARLGADFDAARAYLKVQLVPAGFVLPNWEQDLNFKTFGAGIKAALVYDLPTCVHTVPADDVRRWGRAGAELFEVAAANVRSEADAPTIEHIDVADANVSFEQLLGDSFFACSHAMWLDRHPQATSNRGVLVAVPSRHAVLFHPIRNASAWRALSTLPFVAADLHAKLPGPISPNLYWIKDGNVIDIPIHNMDGNLQVTPPDSLTSAMSDLPEA